MSRAVELTIIVPAYNEARRISKTLKSVTNFMRKTGLRHEVLVIDDGSSDKTRTVVEGLELSHVKVLSYGENRGKGYAVHYGVEHAAGAWILFIDADNSTPIQEFEKLWPHQQEYRVIVGSRYVRGSNIAVRQGVPRIIMSRLGNVLMQLLILWGINDSQCGFKLFEAEAAEKIFARQTIWRWGFDMEILRIARELGYSIKEVPVKWLNDDQSKLQSRTVFLTTLGELFAIKKNSLLGRYRA